MDIESVDCSVQKMLEGGKQPENLLDHCFALKRAQPRKPERIE
jgi:hypothetical protein